MIHLRYKFIAKTECITPGEWLRYYRKLRAISTRTLAEAINIVPATILMYENNRHPIPYNIAVRLSEFLEIDKKLLFDDFCKFLDFPYTEKLKRFRHKTGLSQCAFAKLIGVKQSIYAKLECGARRPSRKFFETYFSNF